MNDDYYKDKYKRMGCAIFLTPLLALPLFADEIKFQFKSPAFSGIGYSAHVLTIENQEYTRSEAIRLDLEAKLEEQLREANNSLLERWKNNLQSRILSNISRQITDSLFSDDPQLTGSFVLFDNVISWDSDGTFITLTIYNTLDGTTTEITIPVNSFGFTE
jgi:curli production assembly/transport component CsgF